MRVMIFGIVCALLAGCVDSGGYSRGYVITHSHLDELIDEAESIMSEKLEP